MTQKVAAPPVGQPVGANGSECFSTQRSSEADNSPTRSDRQGRGLLAEFATQAARAQDGDVRAWLLSLGVHESVLSGVNDHFPEAHPWRARACMVGVGRIEAGGDYYQPCPDGRPAIIVPVARVYDPCTFAPDDLIAFFPDRPGVWYSRTGRGDVLGEDAIARAVFTDRPLILRESPLVWLQTGALDCVVLDWSSARLALGSCRRLLAGSPEINRRLHAAFKTKGPEIRLARPLNVG